MFSKNLVLLFIFLIISFCSNHNSSNNSENFKSLKKEDAAHKFESVAIIKTPQSGDLYNLGDSIRINIKIKQKVKKADSTQFFIDNKYISSHNINGRQVNTNIIINDISVGTHNFKTIIFYPTML